MRKTSGMSEEQTAEYMRLLVGLEIGLEPIWRFALEHGRSSVFNDLEMVRMIAQRMIECDYSDEETSQAQIDMLTHGHEADPPGDVEWQMLWDDAMDIMIAVGKDPYREA